MDGESAGAQADHRILDELDRGRDRIKLFVGARRPQEIEIDEIRRNPPPRPSDGPLRHSESFQKRTRVPFMDDPRRKWDTVYGVAEYVFGTVPNEFLAQVASLQLRAVEQRESLVYRLKLEESHNRIVTNAAPPSRSVAPYTDATDGPIEATGMPAAISSVYFRNRAA